DALFEPTTTRAYALIGAFYWHIGQGQISVRRGASQHFRFLRRLRLIDASLYPVVTIRTGAQNVDLYPFGVDQKRMMILCLLRKPTLRRRLYFLCRLQRSRGGVTLEPLG